MKEAKSSFGSAVRTLRGNVLMRLLMMLEIPTASESSISILSEGEKDRKIMYVLTVASLSLKGSSHNQPQSMFSYLEVWDTAWACIGPVQFHWKSLSMSTNTSAAIKGDLWFQPQHWPAVVLAHYMDSGNTRVFSPQKEQSRSAFLYAPNCGSNPYQMDLNCKQKSSITADWRTCRMVFRWCNWKNAPGIGDYRMAETERGRSGERETPTHYAYLFSNSKQQCMRECVCYLKLQRHQSIFIDIAENLQCEYLHRTMPTVSKLNSFIILSPRKDLGEILHYESKFSPFMFLE